MIILYGPAVAPYTEKVRRALLFKKLDFQLREPESPEDFKRWSPETGKLPVLEIDGKRTADSTAILLELDRLHPDPPLVSPEPMVASQQRQLEDWADESLAWYFSRWLRMRDEGANGAQASPRRGLARVPSLRRVLAFVAAGGTFERPETNLLRSIGARLDDLLNFLGTRPFFYAEQMSMADLAVYGMLYTLRHDAIPGAARLISDRPLLLEFMHRVEMATEA